MPTKRPKYDQEIRGVRVRVFASRSSYDVLVGDNSLDDPDAEVWQFPKTGTVAMWAEQGRLNHGD